LPVRLSLDEPAGALSGSFSLQSAHWRSETLDIQVQDLQVDWRPVELLRGRLVVSRLAAASLRIANVASSEPVAVPDSLRLPLAVEVEQMLGRAHRNRRLRAARGQGGKRRRVAQRPGGE
jgi:translocation and assembly module TamB